MIQIDWTFAPESVEAGARALHKRNGFVPWEKVTEAAREAYRLDAKAVLSAALSSSFEDGEAP